jgi:1,4-alpha-glucan branching enzyme
MSTHPASTPAPGPLEFNRVYFVLRRPAVQAYLMLTSDVGQRLAFEPMVWKDGAWRLTLALPPGAYRYRYYVSNGTSTAYFSPADTDPVGRKSRMDGIDGVFDVAPAPAQTRSWLRRMRRATRPLRPGYSSLPYACQGAFF